MASRRRHHPAGEPSPRLRRFAAAASRSEGGLRVLLRDAARTAYALDRPRRP